MTIVANVDRAFIIEEEGGVEPPARPGRVWVISAAREHLRDNGQWGAAQPNATMGDVAWARRVVDRVFPASPGAEL